MTTAIPALDAILDEDLNYICKNLSAEFAEMSGCKLLITGGAGFLGYYMVQAVTHWNASAGDADQISLTVFDNFFRGTPDWLSELESEGALQLRKVDMIEPLPADMDDFHYIIHAAGIASPMYYRRFPIECMDANINGLRNLFDHCVLQKSGDSPIRGFLFYSSSEVYGDPAADMIPTDEDYRGNVSFTGPRACYDESKRYGETLCVNFAEQHDLPIKMARPFNNYGPGLKITDKRVIPDFARNVFDGQNIVMLSDGSPTRTFCYVADAVCGYYKVLVRGHQGEAYNVGVETPEISMRQLAEKIVACSREMFGYDGEVVLGASEGSRLPGR